MGVGAELQAEAADSVKASTPIPPQGFILNENMSGCNLSQMGDFCLCVCVIAVILPLKCVCLSGFPAAHLYVFTHRMCDLHPAAPPRARERAEIVRGEVERWCVSCLHTLPSAFMWTCWICS